LSYDAGVLRTVWELREDGATWREIAAEFGWKRGKTKHAMRAAKAKYRADAGDAERPPAPRSTNVDQEVYATPPTIANRRTAPRVLLRAAVFDIECTDFGTEGYSGYMICCSVFPLDADAVTTLSIRYDEHGDDRRLVREVVALLSQYDILIGHNVAAFDLNWLHSRWFFHDTRGSEVGDWRRWIYFDTYQDSKADAVKTRKSLGNLGDYYGLEGIKTSIFRKTWNDIRSPYRWEFDDTLANVVHHCEQDVILNRNLFDLVWDNALARNPNPLKISKWGFLAGNQRRDTVREALVA